MKDDVNYTILRVGENIFGRLVAEEICPITGGCLKMSFFGPPRLFAKEGKRISNFNHRILPNSAFFYA